MNKVLITGAAGGIGRGIRPLLRGVYPSIRLSDIVEVDPEKGNNNIVGCYHLFEAARRQGVRRVVFATTNHAVGFYRRQRTIDHTVMPRPDSRYGVSKAFGEALGRWCEFVVSGHCVKIPAGVDFHLLYGICECAVFRRVSGNDTAGVSVRRSIASVATCDEGCFGRR